MRHFFEGIILGLFVLLYIIANNKINVNASSSVPISFIVDIPFPTNPGHPYPTISLIPTIPLIRVIPKFKPIRKFRKPISPTVTPSPTPTVNPSITVTSTPIPTPTPTPISYWKIEEGVGNIIHDSAGNSHDLVMVANPDFPSWMINVPSVGLTGLKSNFSLYFDGDNYAKSLQSSSLPLFAQTSVQASVSGDTIYDFNSRFTIQAWIRVDSSGSQDTDRGIISKWSDGQGWAMIIPGMKVVNAMNSIRLLSASVVNDDNWHHVAITWDGSKQFLYMDGRAEGFLTTNQFPLSSGKMFFLATYQPPDHNFKGFIDEVKIYGYARTLEAIIQDAGLIKNNNQ